jgi:hypothetical protein
MKSREIEESDREQLMRWIQNDPEHKHVAPSFFITPADGAVRSFPVSIPEAGAQSFAWCDDDGEVIFYYRISKCERIDIQFNPFDTKSERTAVGLQRGFIWLRQQAQKRGIWQLLFETKNQILKVFCEKLFRFQSSPNEMICYLGQKDIPALGSKLRNSSAKDGNNVRSQ